MKRLLPLALAVALLFLAASSLLSIGDTAGAQSTPTTLIPVDEQPISSPSIIPTPNETSQPTQYLVMAAVVGGLGAIVFLVARESRRNRDRRTPKPAEQN